MQVYTQGSNDRATARLVGALFLISTAAYMLGSGLVDGLLAAPGASAQIAAQRTQLVSGVLLQLVNSAAVVAIGALLYPIVSRQSTPIALGYLGARLVECAFLSVGGIAALALAGAGEGAALGALPAAGVRAAYHVAMIALGLGSMPLCAVLYRARLIPRLLAALGLIGYAALTIGSALELYGLDLHLMHNLPGGVFELALPIWLLARGFGPAAAPTTAEGGRTERSYVHAAE